MHTAVILAGGKSRRMQRDKLRLPFGPESLLESAVARFSRHFDTVYISVAQPGKYPEIDAPRLVDEYPGCGPMAGLHAALKNTGDSGVFLVAADLPFADPLAAKGLVALSDGHDICVSEGAAGRPEPLFGYYQKSLLPVVERSLQSGRYRLASLFDNARVRTVTAAELGDLWQENMLLNINYPEDYERLLHWERP